jgi:hypothetical protein
MEPRYKLLEDLPLSVWLYLKDFLQPTDLENILVTGSHLWKHIFKDTKWLEFAQTFDQCSPFLLGYELSKFRHNRTSNNLYLALVARDNSGDLRYFRKEFFASLQEGWMFDNELYEVRFPSGLILNVGEVLTGSEGAEVPIERIFTNKGDEVYTEYCHYADQAMKVLGPADMTTPNANPREVWDQPASDRESIESGCILKIWHMQKFEKLQIVPRRANGNARHRWPVMVNFETGEHYEHVLEDWDEFFEKSTRQDPSFRDLFNRIMNTRR